MAIHANELGYVEDVLHWIKLTLEMERTYLAFDPPDTSICADCKFWHQV